MLKILFIFFSFFIAGCNANEPFVKQLKPEFETMSFDVVQKKLIVKKELPTLLENYLSNWFDQRVYIDGYEGNMKFIVTEFNQEISKINDGKRVDVSLTFEVIINKPSLSQLKIIEGNISSYGTLTGNFSLSEFDTVIQNAQSDLIVRLSKDLKSKI